MATYGTAMGAHQHAECPWRVQLCASDGSSCGAGVLLDGRYVLTCAHVVDLAAEGGESGEVRVDSVGCEPRWSSPATVVPGTWTAKGETRRGDVALLELRNPPDCGTGARLRRGVDRGTHVRAYGFPHEKRLGQWSGAEVVGTTGYDDWIALRVESGDHPITEGYSGGGVVLDDGAEVAGIVVSGYIDTEHQGMRVGWMLPVSRIVRYIPSVERLGGLDHDSVTPRPPGTAVHSALAREVDRLFSGDWRGTAVVTGNGSGAVGPLPVTLSVDAAGLSASQVWSRIAGHLGLPHDEREAALAVLRHEPPVSLLVDNVDRAQDPDVLVDGLLRPLAEGARLRGARVILGFAGRPPLGLPHEVSLGAEPIEAAGSGPDNGTAEHADAERAVGRLTAVEEHLAARYDNVSPRISRTPPIPPRQAPRLRIRLAAAAGEGDGTAREYAAIRRQADAAAVEATRLNGQLKALLDRRDELRDLLGVLRKRAEERHGTEDLRMEEHYARAHDALYTAPCDLRLAQGLLWRYRDGGNGAAT